MSVDSDFMTLAPWGFYIQRMPWQIYCVLAGGAPPMMLLGVDNSMHDKASGDFTMCRLTLFAPYWVDNRSGLDLLFKDGPSAKGHPLLMGAHTYFDYASVKAPGMPVLQRQRLLCIGT